MVHGNVRLQYLPAPGICPRGSHGVRHRRGGITHAGISEVLRVKSRIIGGKIPCHDGVFKAYFLEGSLPFLDTRLHVRFPAFRESIVHVENDRLYRLREASLSECRQIFGFQSPTMGMVTYFHAPLVLFVQVFSPEKYPDTRVCQPGTRGSFRQQQECSGHQGGKRHLVYPVPLLRLHAHVISQ